MSRENGTFTVGCQNTNREYKLWYHQAQRGIHKRQEI
jgi:hypothetical protein